MQIGLASLLSRVERMSPTRTFVGIGVLIVAIHAATCTLSPTIWQDEVQTLEFGRLMLTPEHAWSFSWMRDDVQPSVYGFIGSLVYEMAVRLLGVQPAVTRGAAIFFALLSAWCLFGWLRARRLQGGWAVVLSIVWLLDPLFVASYRGGRADAPAFALVFGSCWMLRRALADESRSLLVLTGALVGISPFFWPSAPLAALIVPCEAWLAMRSVDSAAVFRRVWPLVTPLGLGALLGLGLGGYLLVTAQPHFLDGAGIILGTQMKPEPLTVVDVLGSTASIMKMAPAMWCSVALSLLLATPGAAVPLLLSSLAVLLTQPYSNRFLYCLPSALLLIAEALQGEPRRARLTPWLRVIVAAAAVWATGSLGARTALAVYAERARDPSIITQFAEEMIGRGTMRVYVEPWEFYYVGRRLGWRMFHLYSSEPDSSRAVLAARATYTIVVEDRIAEAEAWGLDLELIGIGGIEPDVARLPGAKYARYAVFRNRRPEGAR